MCYFPFPLWLSISGRSVLYICYLLTLETTFICTYMKPSILKGLLLPYDNLISVWQILILVFKCKSDPLAPLLGTLWFPVTPLIKFQTPSLGLQGLVSADFPVNGSSVMSWVSQTFWGLSWPRVSDTLPGSAEPYPLPLLALVASLSFKSELKGHPFVEAFPSHSIKNRVLFLALFLSSV